MEQFIKALVVNNTRILQTGVLSAAMCLSIFCFYPDADGKGILYPIAIVFSSMVIEDYHDKLIDMFSLVILILTVFCYRSYDFDILTIFDEWLRYMCLFVLLYAMAIKIEKKNVIENIKSADEEMVAKAIGFIPSLAIGMGICSMILTCSNFLGSFCNDMSLVWQIVSQSNLYIFSVLVYVLFKAWELTKAKMNNYLLIYGIGEGDILVLAILFTFWGFGNGFVILLFSLIVQLLRYKIRK